MVPGLGICWCILFPLITRRTVIHLATSHHLLCLHPGSCRLTRLIITASSWLVSLLPPFSTFSPFPTILHLAASDSVPIRQIMSLFHSIPSSGSPLRQVQSVLLDPISLWPWGLPLFPLLTLPQPHWLPDCSLNMPGTLQSQSLCPCSSSTWNMICMSCSLTSFRSLLKNHLCVSFCDPAHFKLQPTLSESTLFPALFVFHSAFHKLSY